MAKCEFNFAAWNSLFQQRIRQSRRAQGSWGRLVEKGCDPEVLARNAAYGCDFDGAPGNAHLFGEAVREWEWQRQRAERTARQLDVTCKDAAELLCDRNRLLLANACSIAAAELKGDVARIQERIALGEMHANVFLVELVEHVRRRTGSPHYREVCDVLDAAYSAHARDDITAPGEEALRKTVGRFKQRHPEMTSATDEQWGIWAILVVIVLWIITRFSGTAKQSSEGSPPNNGDPYSPDSIATEGRMIRDTHQQISHSDNFSSVAEQILHEKDSEGPSVGLIPDRKRQPE